MHVTLGLAVVLACVAAVPASAATYFVAPGGSDSAPGSSVQPFRTLVRGVSSLKPGDTLLVEPGVYEEVLNYRIPSGSSWSQPVTIKAANPRARPVLRTPPGNSWGLLFQDQQFITLDGFVIDAALVGYDGLKITQPGTHDIRVINTEIKNAPQQGVLTTDGAYALVFTNLDVHDNGRNDFHHGIYLGTSNATVSGSRFYRNSGWGIHVYSGNFNNDVSNNVIAGNVVFENARAGARGDGILASSGTGNTVYNNVVRANRVGIWVGYGASSTTVYHNTVVGNTAEFAVFVGDDATGTIVRNNIVYGNTHDVIENRGVGSLISHNLVGIDPKFVSGPAFDFRLQLGSPAIDAGFPTGVVTLDIRGLSRSSGGAPEIGAYEIDRPPGAPTSVRVLAAGAGP